MSTGAMYRCHDGSDTAAVGCVLDRNAVPELPGPLVVRGDSVLEPLIGGGT